MKKVLLLTSLVMLCVFTTNAKAQMMGSGYYYQQVNVQVQFEFVRYAPQPQMCVYRKVVPNWVRQCGIQAAQVSGCYSQSGPFGGGYVCAGGYVSSTVCAWRLFWTPYTFVDYCGRF